MSIVRLLEEPPAKISGSVRLYGSDGGSIEILAHGRNSRVLRSIRGNRIGMIFQEPMRALSPVFTVGYQVAEAVRLHQHASRAAALQRAAEMFEKVGISDAANRLSQYPHEMSGGQRQRVMIAMALACNPELLIADEPTTALDVTIQAQILELLKELQRQFNLAICLITHDLGIVAQNCSRAGVMYMGKIVETAPVASLFVHPRHPYTIGLLRSVPVPGRGHKEKLATIEGTVPEPDDVPPGCAFGPRCPHFVAGLCDAPQPVPVIQIDASQWSRCYRAKEL
jgi:oligopeptide/dipeptide ABC transporter ATP-binding protein